MRSTSLVKVSRLPPRRIVFSMRALACCSGMSIYLQMFSWEAIALSSLSLTIVG